VGGKKRIVGYRKVRWNDTPKTHETSSKTAKRMKSKKINQRKMPPGLKKFPPVVGGDTAPKTSTSSLPGETVDTYVKRVGKDVERPEDTSDADWEKFQNQLKRL